VAGKRNLEPIIALVDEYLIILIVLALLLYGLYIEGIITLRGFILILLLVGGIMLLITWRIYVVHQRRAYVGPEALIGKTGIVVEDLNPEGMIEVEGELWKALVKGQDGVPRGARVRVIDYNGLTLIVEALGGDRGLPMRRARRH